jgi:hypothetical protein
MLKPSNRQYSGGMTVRVSFRAGIFNKLFMRLRKERSSGNKILSNAKFAVELKSWAQNYDEERTYNGIETVQLLLLQKNMKSIQLTLVTLN